jgi:hypothetical protein
LFAESEDTLSLQKPFKIIISLLDKWEIGQPIINDILTDVMVSLKHHHDSGQHADGVGKENTDRPHGN